ncbi:hypothetical protein [Herbiconiux solani]|uniref:hypothetical protein n=1 Tax=Herbiconiux solani TaxID=661329 RepID=UPI0012ED1C6E|nr:hypothetical protein [Herbiconiux solani]
MLDWTIQTPASCTPPKNASTSRRPKRIRMDILTRPPARPPAAAIAVCVAVLS